MSEEIVVGDNEVFHVHPGELALGVTLEQVEKYLIENNLQKKTF